MLQFEKKTVNKQPTLSTTHQQLADEWHPFKNGSLKPSDLTAKSQRKVWWTCSKNKDHEVQQDVFRRVGMPSLQNGTDQPRYVVPRGGT
jgi:hypothetical protein